MDFQAIVENISEAVFLMDRSGEVLYANPSATMVFGYSAAEMSNLDYEQFIHPDDRAGYKETISKLLSSPRIKLQRNYRLKRRDENYIWLECTYSHLTSTDGEEILCNFRDVTPRVELGQEAAIIYRFYQVIFGINQAVTRATDEQMLFKKVCDIAIDPGNFKMAWIGMLDQTRRELVPIMHSGEGSQPYLEKMQPISLDDALLSGGPAGTAFRTGVFDYSNDIESDPRMRPWLKDALAHGYRSAVSVPIKKFGKIIGVLALYAGVPRYFDSGIIGLLEQTTEDISFAIEAFERAKQHKLVEEEKLKVLKDKEVILNRITDGVISLDNEWRYTFLNDAALATHPMGRAGAIGKSIWEVHPLLVKSVFWDKYHEAMSTKKVVEVDGYFESMDIWFYAKAYPSDDGLTIFYRDVTEQRKASQEILSEKVFSESLIKSLPGIFYLYDEKGRFERWNKNFETISGYSSEEIRGMHPLDFFDLDEKKLLKDKIESVFSSGRDEVTAHFFTKDRKKIPYYFNGHKVFFHNDPYLIGIGIDITDRVRAEKELLAYTKEVQKLTTHLEQVREEERTQIAREIHDELGQQLTALKMDASWVSKKIITMDKSVQEKLSSMIHLIDETVKSVRRISTDLRPRILDDLGLVATLEWFSSDFAKHTGIKSSFQTNLTNFHPSKIISTQIFRVYQEALTNVARHAHASAVETSLEEKDGYLQLTVKDNGDGFDSDKTLTENSWGLVGMRERAMMMQGNLKIEKAKPKGTIITLKVPIAQATPQPS